VTLASPPGRTYLSRFVMPEGEHRITRIGQQLSHDQTHGEFIGMAMFSEKGIAAFRACYQAALDNHKSARFHEAGGPPKNSLADLLQEVTDQSHRIVQIPQI